jgi:hypothetical protein
MVLYTWWKEDDNQRERYGCQSTYGVCENWKPYHHDWAAINASVNTLKGIKFGRVEDLDYKKGTDAGAEKFILMLQDKIQLKQCRCFKN